MRLGLASAARRLYTCCGELITDVQQLVRPYATNTEQNGDMETQQTEINYDINGTEKVSSIITLLYFKLILAYVAVVSFSNAWSERTLTSEWAKNEEKQASERTNERTNQPVNQRTNERTNEIKNERTNAPGGARWLACSRTWKRINC